jgi:hypothetical protein
VTLDIISWRVEFRSEGPGATAPMGRMFRGTINITAIENTKILLIDLALAIYLPTILDYNGELDINMFLIYKKTPDRIV